jgi:hypothetical protein
MVQRVPGIEVLVQAVREKESSDLTKLPLRMLSTHTASHFLSPSQIFNFETRNLSTGAASTSESDITSRLVSISGLSADWISRYFQVPLHD